MPLLSSEKESSTLGRCSDCGHVVARRTGCYDEQAQKELHLCVRCLVWFYHRRQFQAGCCG